MGEYLKTIAIAGAITLIGVVGAHAEDILLGTHVPLTGKLARVGTGMHEGIAVAVDIFNRDNKGRYTVKLITINDETNPAKAVAAVEKMSSQGVVALTGGYGSNIIGPASEAANKAGLVYITSGGVAPGLTQRGHKGFFRINNTQGYSRAMMGLLKDMKVKKVSILYNTKEATSDLAKTVDKDLSGQGIDVVLHAFDGGTSDFKPLINKVKLRDKSDAIGMVAYENDYVAILKAGKVLKPNVKAVVGVWSLATSKMNGEFHDLVQTVYGTSMLPYPAEFTSPEAKDFAETYKKLHGKEPDYLGQFGYVQTKLLLDAILRARKAGTLSTGGLAQEVRKTDSDTLIGQVKFNENGDNPLFSHRMGQHQGEKVVLVWPENAATGDKQFPSTPWSE